MTRPTGYEPLFNLKTVAPDIWVDDGCGTGFAGCPFQRA